MRDYGHELHNSVRSNAAQPKTRRLDILCEIRCIQTGHQDKSFFQEMPFTGTETTDLHTYKQTSVINVFIDVKGTDRTGKPGQSRATLIPDSRSEPFILGKDLLSRGARSLACISGHTIYRNASKDCDILSWSNSCRPTSVHLPSLSSALPSL